MNRVMPAAYGRTAGKAAGIARGFFFAGIVAAAAGAQSAEEIASTYRSVATRITSAALLKNDAHAHLTELCKDIGHRLSGSAALDRALDWSERKFKEAGLENVRRVPCMVPVWVRGEASLEVLGETPEALPLLALGGSVGTPPEGIEAEIVVVRSYVELDALGKDGIAGRIVVYDVPYDGYGKTVQFRTNGAARAAKYGALAALNRAAGHGGKRRPHTGAVRYEDDAPRIPAASLAWEDAAKLGARHRAGEKIRLKLVLGCKNLPDAPSANIVGDLIGGEKPDEFVLVGGHIDSWDVGQGAQDDGGGVVSCLESLAVLKRLGLKPRRTIRLCFFTNEENGLRGARAFFESEKERVAKYVACYENDGGIELPRGFGLSFDAQRPRDQSSRPAESRPGIAPRRARAAAVLSLLAGVGCDRLFPSGGGADIAPFASAGVPAWSISTVGLRYFEWHHTEDDVLEAVDPRELDLHVAAQAALFFLLADLREPI